ncbi:MAG: sulfatase [Verrucomicrobiota bacterium]
MKFALCILCLVVSSATALGARHPDVVMIAIDDLRPMLGCYGNPHIKTPNIDRLAKHGVVFENAYCQYAKCGPSRLSLMTGLRPATTGQYGHSTKILEEFRTSKPDAVSMARWFKDHGYQTRSLGKIDHDTWQIAEDWSEPPFPGRDKEMLEIHDEANPNGPTIIADRWECPVLQNPDVPDNHFFAGRMTKEALHIYRERDARPLFLAIGYRRPHLPFVAPKKYYDLYQPDESWLAKNQDPPANAPSLAWFNSWHRRKSAVRDGAVIPQDPAELSQADWMAWNGYELRSYLGVPPQELLQPALQVELLHAYAACVSYIDAQIGKMLKAIDLDNTIVVLWSDHGWHLGEHSAWAKVTNFEIATRVPFIVVAPGIPPARTSVPTELVDLYPSLCELAGLNAPKHLEGESFVALMTDPTSTRDRVALSEIDRHLLGFHGYAMRTSRYRIVQWRDNKTGEVTALELYDHQNDPNETRNIAQQADLAPLVAQLTERLESEFNLP